MSGLLTRVGELFIAAGEPGARVVPAAAVAGPVPASAAVLGAAGEAPGVAGLLASELRLRCRASCAMVGEWRADGAPAERPGVGSRAAKALVGRLEARGLEAVAAGRLVRVALPCEPDAAVAAWRRAVAAADCSAVLAIAGARPAAFDVLLGEQDLVAVVLDPASAELSELAVAGLSGVRAPVVACRPVPGGLARLAMSSSLATSHALGPDLARAVRALA